MKKALLFAVAFLLTACTSPIVYKASDGVGAADVAQQSKIITDQKERESLAGLNMRLVITKVDGKSTGEFCVSRMVCYADAAVVDPGRHYVSLMYQHANTFARGEVWFDAEPAKNYIVRKNISGYAIRMWVEELETGRVVGGIPGGEPEMQQPPKPQPIGT